MQIFLRFLERIVGHKFNEIKFVSAEDNETNFKHRTFYKELRKCAKVKIDKREYKYKTSNC